MRRRLTHRLALATALVAGLLAAPAGSATAASATPAAPAMALTRADLWTFADRRMTELDPLWRANCGASVPGGG